MTITDETGLDPADDFVHEPPAGVDRWAENIQWNVRDKDGLGVMWHMGTMLDDPRLWHIVIAVTQPDGTVHSTKIVAPGAGQFGSPNAHLATITPYREWRFTFFGGMVDVSQDQGATGLTPDDHHHSVQIDLDLEAAYPVWIPEGSTSSGTGDGSTTSRPSSCAVRSPSPARRMSSMESGTGTTRSAPGT